MGSKHQSVLTTSCTHGEHHVVGGFKVRVLNLQCNCSWARRIFDGANRYIGRLDPTYWDRIGDTKSREEYEEALKLLFDAL